MKAESITEKQRESGQAALEILVAIVIIMLSMAAVISVSTSNQSLTIDARYENQAIYITQEALEEIRAQARDNFNAIAATSSRDGIYLKEIVIENIDTYQKKVTSRVSWNASSSRPEKVELSVILTDWQAVQSPGAGDTGGGGLSGDWRTPQTLGSMDIGPGNSGTDLDVINKIVYLTSVASDSKKSDFYVIDATDGQHPSLRGSVNTGPGLNAVDALGQYAYVANSDANAQLQIINVADPGNPTLVASLKLSDVSGSGAIGQSIFYASGTVYIGTEKATGPEFHVIDVSNPQNPIELGSREINADVNDILVKDNLAYLATSDEEELKVLDVSNFASIAQIGGFDAPGESEDGKSLYLVGTKLYLGRLVGGNHLNHHEFHILDVSSSTSIQNLGSKDLATDLNDLVVRDYLAFFATSDPNKEFQIWNISDPASPALWASFNFPQVATGIDYEDNRVYVSVRSNDALRIITASP